MKKQRILILLLFVLIFSLSACSGRRVTASGWPGLTVHGDFAFLAGGPHIYAVKVDNGELEWKYPPEPQNEVTFYAKPALTEDGQLIVGGYNGVIYSLDPENGVVNWTSEDTGGRFIASPLVTDVGIFAPSANNNVYALDHNGNQLWAPFETEDPIWAQPSTDEGCDCIYVASMDHHVYAINAQTGALLWKTEDLGGPVVSSPTVFDDIMVVGTFANEVLAIDLTSKTVKWRFETEDWAWASPIVDEEQVYASDIGGNFYALDRETGEQNWQIEPGGKIVTAPLIAFDTIYFGTSEGLFIGLDKEGEIQQNITLENGKLYSGIAASEDLLLVAPSESEELLLGFDQGVRTWSFSLSDNE
jgi:outer membrane protein assembly factor BamB